MAVDHELIALMPPENLPDSAYCSVMAGDLRALLACAASARGAVASLRRLQRELDAAIAQAAQVEGSDLEHTAQHEQHDTRDCGEPEHHKHDGAPRGREPR